MKSNFKRILLKLSGEGLAGENKTGIDMDIVLQLAENIARIRNENVQLCLVVGGGNFFRGAKNAGAYMDRSEADQIGMMATVINALALRSALQQIKCPAEIFSGLAIPQVCKTYKFSDAIQAVEENKVVIFAGGTGAPYFTTDTGAALRAIEMHCDVLLKATQVDGVYSADPRYNPQAVRYDKISYDEVIEKQLNVMDMTAVAMVRDNHLPVMIFALHEQDSLLKAVRGEIKHTMIQD